MRFDFSFSLAPVAKVYCDAIARELMSSFDIDCQEATGRMNRHWAKMEFTSEEDIDVLTQELPYYWARRIYFGPDAKWWVDGETHLTPVPYP